MSTPRMWRAILFVPISGPCPSSWTCPMWPQTVRGRTRRQEVDRVPSYRVIVGIDYPPDRRAEPGDVVDDLPGKSIKWLTEDGFIEPAAKATSKSAAKLAADIEPEGDEN